MELPTQSELLNPPQISSNDAEVEPAEIDSELWCRVISQTKAVSKKKIAKRVRAQRKSRRALKRKS